MTDTKEWQLTQQAQIQITERSMKSVLEALRKSVKGVQEARRKVGEAVRQHDRGVHRATLSAAMASAPPLGGVLTTASTPRNLVGHIITPPPTATAAGGTAGRDEEEEDDLACPLPPMLPLAVSPPLAGVRRPREEEGGDGGRVRGSSSEVASLRKRPKPSGASATLGDGSAAAGGGGGSGRGVASRATGARKRMTALKGKAKTGSPSTVPPRVAGFIAAFKQYLENEHRSAHTKRNLTVMTVKNRINHVSGWGRAWWG